MKVEPVKVVHVYYVPNDDKIPVGRLMLKSRKIFFEYDAKFLGKRLQLSPFKLPLKSGVMVASDSIFDGLFGVFNDSLPDGWGRLLLDRSLRNRRINPASLSMLDRLCFVGNQGMGALCYEPELAKGSTVAHVDLDEIAAEVAAFQDHHDDRFVEDLLQLGGSSGGARPKVLMDVDDAHWLIKFRSSVDPKDIGAIEYAYHLMAVDSGLQLSDAKLFPSRTGLGFFGSKRFDRFGSDRIHMHTVSGLLHADHRVPSLDYEVLAKVTMHLTRDVSEYEKQFRQCVFNVLSHNRDDHAKNFSFLMDSSGVWRTSPSYDLTFSSGPGGEHCTMVMGEGKNPGLSHLLALAGVSGLKRETAMGVVDEVLSSVMKWSEFASQAGVSKASAKLVETAIKNVIKVGF